MNGERKGERKGKRSREQPTIDEDETPTNRRLAPLPIDELEQYGGGHTELRSV